MGIFKSGNFNFELGRKIYVMGILNITPDSFSDGGLWNTPEKAILRALEIEKEGADILDIGAQSTRPGYKAIPENEELNRITPILKEIRKLVKIPISVDTFYPSVAQEAINLGADIINDITGFSNNDMFRISSESGCGCIIMHSSEGLDIMSFFENRLNQALRYGLKKEQICFDPGIGFGKTYDENLYILSHLSEFKIKENALLVGASRKRVIGQSCGNPPFSERMPGTIAAHTIAALNGADIIRVHDVKESVQAAKVTDKIIKVDGEK